MTSTIECAASTIKGISIPKPNSLRLPAKPQPLQLPTAASVDIAADAPLIRPSPLIMENWADCAFNSRAQSEVIIGAGATAATRQPSIAIVDQPETDSATSFSQEDDSEAVNNNTLLTMEEEGVSVPTTPGASESAHVFSTSYSDEGMPYPSYYSEPAMMQQQQASYGGQYHYPVDGSGYIYHQFQGDVSSASSAYGYYAQQPSSTSSWSSSEYPASYYEAPFHSAYSTAYAQPMQQQHFSAIPPCRFPVPPPPLKARTVLSNEAFERVMHKWYVSTQGWDQSAPQCPQPSASGTYEEWLHMVDDWYVDEIAVKSSCANMVPARRSSQQQRGKPTVHQRIPAPRKNRRF